MDKRIWTEIKTIFFNAVELDDKQREAYLNDACKTPELKKEILTLISAHDKSETFLEEPIVPIEPVSDNSNLFIGKVFGKYKIEKLIARGGICLLYTSDAADERSSVDLGGRRIIKKKKKVDHGGRRINTINK